MSRQKKATMRPFNVDDVDHFNRELRFAFESLLLVQKTLAGQDVRIVDGDIEDSDGLTGAVYGSVESVRERLVALNEYVDRRWSESTGIQVQSTGSGA